MASRRGLLFFLAGLGVADQAKAATSFAVTHAEDEWRKILTPAQFAILRRKCTEYPGSSVLDHETRAGRYDCAGCAQPAFSASTKFDSHTGWPSFWAPLQGSIATTTDRSFFMTRTEVHCSNCGGHFGHVFPDGPAPTGLRYCMNGAALSFHPDAS